MSQMAATSTSSLCRSNDTWPWPLIPVPITPTRILFLVFITWLSSQFNVKWLLLFQDLLSKFNFDDDKENIRIANSLNKDLPEVKMKATLTKLCSDEFGGRKSSLEGGDLACDFLIKQLKQNKIKAGNKGFFRQSIEAYHQSKSNKFFNDSATLMDKLS